MSLCLFFTWLRMIWSSFLTWVLLFNNSWKLCSASSLFPLIFWTFVSSTVICPLRCFFFLRRYFKALSFFCSNFSWFATFCFSCSVSFFCCLTFCFSLSTLVIILVASLSNFLSSCCFSFIRFFNSTSCLDSDLAIFTPLLTLF